MGMGMGMGYGLWGGVRQVQLSDAHVGVGV